MKAAKAARLLTVADQLETLDKEALKKMRELLNHSHWELGQRRLFIFLMTYARYIISSIYPFKEI